MSQISRPMQIALAAVLVFAGVWFVALRPKPAADAPAPNAPGVAGLKRAIGKAHGAVDAANAQSQRAAGRDAAAPSAGASTGVKSASRPGGARVTPFGHPRTAGAARVNRALAEHRTVGVLFYNSRSSDDRAVRRELDHADRHMGRVVIVEASISQLSDYSAITNKGMIAMSPTLALVDGDGHMEIFSGFVDGLQIAQAIWDDLGLTGSNLGHLLHTAPLSLHEYHRRAKAACRRADESVRDAVATSAAGVAPDEVAPALHNLNEIAANDFAAFASLTPPRRLLAAHRAVVAADYSLLATLRGVERAVARSSNPLREFFARWPSVRDEIRTIGPRASAESRRLGVRCA